MSIGSSAELFNTMYGGPSSGGLGTSALPPQAIPKKEKTEKWFEECLDRLEEIGMQQLNRNVVFNEYYKMLEGNLSYLDFDDTPEVLRGVVDLRDRLDIPSFVEHFDIIGISARAVQNKYSSIEGKFRVDFFRDDLTVNDYDRELSNRLFHFVQEMFSLELQTLLLQNGIEPKEQFESEEEQQQYMQTLQEAKAMLVTPPEIKSAMDTQWRPVIAEWAKSVIDRDKTRFNIREKYSQYFIDRFLTGRFFNHYRIGYDYYITERWHPRETFISEEENLKHPQHAEYVGNIQYLTPSQFVDRHGHHLTEGEQKKLLNQNTFGKGSKSRGKKNINSIDFLFGVPELIPDANYYDRKASLALQETVNAPLETISYFGEDGETRTAPHWIQDYGFNTGFSFRGNDTRRDIAVRRDTFPVMTTYWRSWERVGLLYYTTEFGFNTSEWVTEDILEGFLESQGVETLKTMSLHEFNNRLENGTLEPNSIVYTYIPKIYKGIKARTSHTSLKKDLYLDAKELEFQIKGDSNVYDVQIPVGGIVTNSIAERQLPYQKSYNYQMNLIRSLTEKEIGTFWLIDIGMLPSEFQGMGEAREILTNVVEMARDIGLVPVDLNQQSARHAKPNQMIPQEISFIKQIQQKVEMAEYYKRLALEQVGLSMESINMPSQYATAEGLRMGQSNEEAQLSILFNEMDEARLKDMEIHLAVAQYCEPSGKDITVNYTRKDEEQMLVRQVFQDPNFHLRKIGLLPTKDLEERRDLETFKQYLLSSNTFSNDLSDFATVLFSKSGLEIRNVLEKAKRENQEEVQAQRAHEAEIEETRNEGAKEMRMMEVEYQLEKQEKELKNRLDVARIYAASRANDSTGSDVDTAYNEANIKLREKDIDNRNDIALQQMAVSEEDNKTKNEIAMLRIQKELDELNLKREQLEVRRQEDSTKKFTSIINKD